MVGVTEFLVAVGFIERPGNNMFEWSTDDDKDVDNTRSKLDFALVALEMMNKRDRTKHIIGVTKAGLLVAIDDGCYCLSNVYF